MYLEIFLADLAVFRVFVGISRVRNCTKYQKPCQKTNFPKCYSIDNHCSSDFFSRAGEKGRGFHIVYKEEIVNYYIKFFSWGGEGWGLRGGGGVISESEHQKGRPYELFKGRVTHLFQNFFNKDFVMLLSIFLFTFFDLIWWFIIMNRYLHIQTSAIKCKYPIMIVCIFLFQRVHI